MTNGGGQRDKGVIPKARMGVGGLAAEMKGKEVRCVEAATE